MSVFVFAARGPRPTTHDPPSSLSAVCGWSLVLLFQLVEGLVEDGRAGWLVGWLPWVVERLFNSFVR